MPIPRPSDSWRLSVAGRGNESRNCNGKQERDRRLPTAAATNSNDGGPPRKRYPFSSLLSSRNRNNRTRLNRVEASTKNQDAAASAASAAATTVTTANTIASLRRTPLLRHRSIPETGSTRTASIAAVTPTATQRESTPPAPSVMESDLGCDLLEFGASVEFHEDHRRHIHAETQAIEASNVATKESLTRECRTEAQLRKDLGRAGSELQSLHQGANDQLESAKTFATLVKNLEGQFTSELVTPTRSKSETQAPCTGTEGEPQAPSHPVTPEGRKEASPPGDKPERPRSHQEMLSQKKARAMTLLQALQDETKKLEGIRAQTHSLEEKRVQLEESMEFQGLQDSLDRAQDEERKLQAELREAQDTKATRIVEIQQIRDACGTKAQKCTDLTKELTEAKKSNAAEEAKMLGQVQAIQSEVDRLAQEKEEMHFRIEEEKRNLEKASKQMDEYHYYCKAKEDYDKEKALRAETKKELLSRLAQAKRKLQEQQAEEQASLQRKKRAEEAMLLAETKKKVQVEKEATILPPGKAELAKLAERKEKLAAQMNEASKTAEKEQIREREALAAKTRAKQEAIEETKRLEIEYKAKQEEHEATIREHAEYIRSHQEQIESHSSHAKKFEDLYQAEEESYQAKLQEARERWSAKLRCHAQEQERMNEAHAFRLEVLERGIKMHQDAEKAEREAEAF